MDIAVIAPDLSQHGGAEHVALAQAALLAARGHRVHLYSSAFSPSLLAQFKLERLARTQLSHPGHSHAERFAYAPARWSREIADHDIYLAHQFPLDRLQCRPLAWYAHEPFRLRHDLAFDWPLEDGFFDCPLEELLAPDALVPSRILTDHEIRLSAIAKSDRAPDAIIANSRQCADWLSKLYDQAASVLFPAVDLDPAPRPMTDWKTENRRFRLLWVGQCSSAKRWRLAVDCLPQLPDCELWLVGGGGEQAIDRAAALGVSDRLKPFGRLEDEQLQALWPQVDAVLACHLNEPFGLVPLEAAARGIPSVITEDMGVAEILADSAMIAPPTVPALCQAIRALAEDAALRTRLAAQARQVAVTHGWDSHIQQLETLLQALAAAGTAPQPQRLSILETHYRGSPDEFSGAMPEWGYYRSDEGWVIDRQLRQSPASDGLLLTIRAQDRQQLIYSMFCAQRVIAVSARRGETRRFALAIRTDMDTPPEQVSEALRLWAASSAPAVRLNNDKLVVLFGPLAVPPIPMNGIRLLPADQLPHPLTVVYNELDGTAPRV